MKCKIGPGLLLGHHNFYGIFGTGLVRPWYPLL